MSQNQNEKESGGQEPKTDSNSDFRIAGRASKKKYRCLHIMYSD